MSISTKGRYALRVLIDLAEHNNGKYIPMKDVAKRQEISLKYLEQIMPVLSKNNLVKCMKGKGGGYMICKDPECYTVWEVLSLTEGNLAPVTCLESGSQICNRSTECRTLPMWKEYHKLTKDFFSNITIFDLMKTPENGNYII